MKEAPKRRSGRPPKKSGKLENRLVVLIDAERDEKYHRAADAAGLDFSDWVRRALDKAAGS